MSNLNKFKLNQLYSFDHKKRILKKSHLMDICDIPKHLISMPDLEFYEEMG